MFSVFKPARFAAPAFALILTGCGGLRNAPTMMPPQELGQVQNNTALASSTVQQSTTITAAMSAIQVQGPIVKVLSGGGVSINAGTHYGYINLYPSSTTKLLYGGLTPTVGYYVIGTVRSLSSTAPLAMALYKAQPTLATVIGQVESQQAYGVIMKVTSSGASVPLVLATSTSATTSLAVGGYVSASGAGSTATAIFPTSLSASAAPSVSVPAHVLVSQRIYGYAGTPTTVPLSSIAPYISWTATDSIHAPIVRAAGIKVYLYLNFWRNYTSDDPAMGYYDLKPGGAHARAEAKTCTGAVIYDSTYGGGYEADARNSYAPGHAQMYAAYFEKEFAGNYDALFSDDTGAVGGLPQPCNWSLSTYQSASNAIHSSLGKPVFVNALGSWAPTTPVQQVGYTNASNIVGAMGEGFYAEHGSTGDYPDLGSVWTGKENAEIATIANHKIFWDCTRAVGAAQNEIPLRNFVNASFLLTYAPSYAMIQTSWATYSKFSVMPETGLVPEQPRTTATSVTGYLASGGAYIREFAACYYRRANKGPCAVVVNPSTTSVPIPKTSTSYAHSMVLSGSDVLDGGIATFSGAKPSSLGSGQGVVLFQ